MVRSPCHCCDRPATGRRQGGQVRLQATQHAATADIRVQAMRLIFGPALGADKAQDLERRRDDHGRGSGRR